MRTGSFPRAYKDFIFQYMVRYLHIIHFSKLLNRSSDYPSILMLIVLNDVSLKWESTWGNPFFPPNKASLQCLFNVSRFCSYPGETDTSLKATISWSKSSERCSPEWLIHSLEAVTLSIKGWSWKCPCIMLNLAKGDKERLNLGMWPGQK